ncbi:MAG TPA: carbon storage regulator CsrA [Turneriella sp.]|nr:carbon storage regulator CsrA [Turneriella sp.]
MLVLARRVNDSIVIGDSVEIVVVEIKGDQVKLGVKAPKDVKVFRGEIHAEIQKENKAALESQLPPDLDTLLSKKK